MSARIDAARSKKVSSFYLPVLGDLTDWFPGHTTRRQPATHHCAERGKAGGIPKAIQTNAAPSGSTPSPSDADLMQNLDDTGRASVEKLRALKGGSEFDRDYIRYEVEGHRKLLDIQEVYRKAPDKSRPSKCREARPGHD